MPSDYAYTAIDRAAAAIDRRLLLTFDRKFKPVVEALKDLPHELRRPALQLMEGLHRVKKDDRDKAALIAAAARCDHRPTFRYRAAAFMIAMGGVLDAVIQTFNDISRQSRAALGGYLVAADQGQRPSKAGFECADSRCGTEASGEGHGDAFAHRSPGILDAIAPSLDGLGEGAKKTLRLAVHAETPWINVAPHFDCAALTRIYEICRKCDGAGARTAYERDDEAYGRHHEWLVRTVEERMGGAGFGVYEDLGLVFIGSDDEKFVDAMAVELGLVVGRMADGLSSGRGRRPQPSGGDRLARRPGPVCLSVLPFETPLLQIARGRLSVAVLSVGGRPGSGRRREPGRATADEEPRAWTFPALVGPLERAARAHGRDCRRRPSPING